MTTIYATSVDLIMKKEETRTKKTRREKLERNQSGKGGCIQRLSKKVPNVTNVRPPRASLHEVVTWTSGGHLTLVLSRVHLVSGFRPSVPALQLRSSDATTSNSLKEIKKGVQRREQEPGKQQVFESVRRACLQKESDISGKSHFCVTPIYFHKSLNINNLNEGA